ncbi:arginyltransferase [Methylophaga sp. OBS4]|uniref:arginyltransferase n=1 Tax=Methylophaga sp. OBS4 TaxID=2991935 RepID=UPI002259F1F1|nr:arginyltransferase [Methylophaga sp. OBS4]MCX4188209.1 arginyltransferase [Methylophaga sp. OBS4]
MSLDFYQDQPHACSYLEGRRARNIYPDPNRPLNKQLYSHLIQHGFRRSGDHIYRPYCPDCEACVPVRINVADFKPNRSQRRCLQRNRDIQLKIKPAEFSSEHFDLYCRYLAGRHRGGGMDNPSVDSYINFLISSWCDTAFIEFRLQEQLVAVAVTDFIINGASAFYTFFNPEMSKRSLGTLAILKQIELARNYELSWLYLGYWIEESPKMCYKSRFSAIEAYQSSWRPLNKKL